MREKGRDREGTGEEGVGHEGCNQPGLPLPPPRATCRAQTMPGHSLAPQGGAWRALIYDILNMLEQARPSSPAARKHWASSSESLGAEQASILGLPKSLYLTGGGW